MDSDKYVKIRSEDLVGIVIFIFVKKAIRMHIKEINTSKLKLGMANFANKGSCAIRFNYKDSSLAFASSHLESGQGTGLDVQRRH